MQYIYHYKGHDYQYWYLVKALPDFKNVSFPKEGLLTDEILNPFGITRTPYVPPAPSLDVVKVRKKNELTEARDAEEYNDVTTDKGAFEFDAISQMRLRNAQSSIGELQTRTWTTKDGVVVIMYKSDFQAIFDEAATRSDTTFAKWKDLIAQVNIATTVAEVEAIHW